MIPLWLLTFDFWKNKSTRSNRRLQILFIATAALFILTVARSATIGLIISGLVFLWGLDQLNKHRDYLKFIAKAWGSALLLALVLVLVSGVVAIFIPKNAIHNDSGLSSLKLFGGHAVDVNDGSARTRYDLWPKSIGLIEKHPLEGAGANNSRIELNIEKWRQGAAPNRLQPFNNDLIALAVDLGLLALVFFGPLFAFLLRAFYQLFKKGWNSIAAPFALILVGMLIQGNFFQSLLLTRLWVVIGLLLAFLYTPSLDQASANQKRIVPRKTAKS
jgi:O-antigen ligase